MSPEQAEKIVEELGGRRVKVRTTYGKVLSGVLIKATDKAVVVDTPEPGQRGIFLQQVDRIWDPQADGEGLDDTPEKAELAEGASCRPGGDCCDECKAHGKDDEDEEVELGRRSSEDDDEEDEEDEEDDKPDRLRGWRDRIGLAAYDPLELRDYSDRTREVYAKKGVALPDGSFPIRNRKDLKAAVLTLGRAKNQERARAHIVKRAKELEATDELPPSWPESTSGNQAASARLYRMERAVSSLARLVFSSEG